MIAMVAVLYFWNKQQRKMKREMAREAKSSEFGSNSSDLDLDNIIEEDSTGRGPSGLNRSSDSSSTTETDLERQADGANFKRSGTRATRGGKPARSTSRMYGQPRIKGLRIIPRIPNSEVVIPLRVVGLPLMVLTSWDRDRIRNQVLTAMIPMVDTVNTIIAKILRGLTEKGTLSTITSL